MSTFLSRVGAFSARFRWAVVGTWVLIFSVLIGILISGKSGSSTDEAAEQPAKAQELQLVIQPRSGDVSQAATVKELNALLAQAAKLPGVETVSDPLNPKNPYVSEDKAVAVATLSYGELDEDQQKEFYADALEFQQQADADLGVQLGGNLAGMGETSPGAGEGIGVILAFIVLALTFGSMLAAGVNLLLSVFGVGVGLVGVLAYGTINPIDSNSIILAAMLGLAVGIDYSLFIISRFRSELRSGRSVQESIARATGTAGTAVVFAGLTVIVALVALLVAEISTITQMGLAAAFAVGVAVLISLTLLPALLGFMGTKVLSRKQRRNVEAGIFVGEDSAPKRGFISSWAKVVTKRPVMSMVAGLALLIVVAIPVLSMKTAFHIPGGTDPQSTERSAYNLIVDEFGGVQSPLVVIATGSDLDKQMPALEKEISGIDGVQNIMAPEESAPGQSAQLIVVPEEGPIDQSTKDIVHTIRDQADSIEGVHLDVTGETAMGIDQDQDMMDALVKYLIVIVAISIVLLILLFRSILVPVIATLGFLLSVGASFGASVAVFQWGWLDAIIAAPQGDPMLSLLPLILVGVLFGLAMDYQVFLVSRMQEMHRKGGAPIDAVREGFTRSAAVVIAAASIMTVVFAGFASSSFAVAASIAFGLTVGVMADAFIVRMVLMPAALTLLGNAAWWMPRWLDKILPNVDAEGHGLDAADEVSVSFPEEERELVSQ